MNDRDRSIVEWIGRLGPARATEVMARFGCGRRQTYYRVRALVRVGLLEARQLLRGQPTLCLATRAGLSWALARFEPCRVSAASATHWALCASVAVLLELLDPGYRVWSERESRAADSKPAAPWRAPCWADCPIAVRGYVAPTSSSCARRGPAADRGRGRAGGQTGAPAPPQRPGNGDTTCTRGREFDVHPDEIKRLHTGRALVACPGGALPRITRMLHPEDAR